MDQNAFRCETCGSPHVSIPSILKPEVEVVCGRCGAFVATWGYCGALALILINERRYQTCPADPAARYGSFPRFW